MVLKNIWQGFNIFIDSIAKDLQHLVLKYHRLFHYLWLEYVYLLLALLIATIPFSIIGMWFSGISSATGLFAFSWITFIAFLALPLMIVSLYEIGKANNINAIFPKDVQGKMKHTNHDMK